MNVEEYVQLLLDGDEQGCLRIASAHTSTLEGLHDVYVNLVAPSQYRVGYLWESGKISVASEHLATAINSFEVSSAYAPLAIFSPGGPKGVVSCTPDETHELGPRMLSDLLECDGWDIDFFGATMPRRELVGVVESSQPRFVGLSAALVSHLGSVKTTVDMLHAELGGGCPPIIVGGNAFRTEPGLVEMVGADLFIPDASLAVDALKQFKN